MNLFKKMLLKAVKNENTHSAIINDIGPLKGEVSWEAFRNGMSVMKGYKRNAVVYAGKSSLLKMLSQTPTPHISAFNAEDYKISRLRLGNAPTDSYYPFASINPLDGTVDNDPSNIPLHYYDLTKKSYRNNLTLASGRSGAGGKCGLDSGQTASESGTSVSQDINFTSGMISSIDTVDGITIDLGNAPFSGMLSGDRAPDPNSLSVELWLFGGIAYEVKASFINTKGYNRKTALVPLEVPNGKNHLNLDASNGCRLYFDYNDSHWKVKIRTKAGIGTLYTNGKLRVKFTIGRYNIINSVVPKTGWNRGFGTTSSSRFGSSLDYYAINSNNNFFEDSEADDIGVTFSTIINGPEGNGEYENVNGYDVVYTEAFLFNSIDQLFSMVKFEDPIVNPLATDLGFIKNKTLSYNISWKLSAFI